MPEETKSTLEQTEQDISDLSISPETETRETEVAGDEIIGSKEAQAIIEESKVPEPQAIVVPLVPKKPLIKKPILIALIVLLLAGGFAGVYWFALRGDNTVSDQTATSEQNEIQRFGIAAGLIEGVVEYSTDGSTTWQKLESETELKEGDYVRTLADGRLVLLIDDGSAVRLSTNSTVSIKSLDVSNVVVENVAGEVYSRVTASSTRKYSVGVEGTEYTAKGTAFRTINTGTKKGVEVFHSAVAKGETEVTEGNAFLTVSEQKEKENVVSALDLSALKKDEFIKWNSEQDKKQADFASALGVLTELDKPDPTPPPVVSPPSSGSKTGITLSGTVSEYSAVFSWKVSGVDVSQGYKLVKSKTSQTPTYPENSAAYIGAGKTSYNLYLGDGKTYYYRICAYRGDSCVSYSNTVTLTTPVKTVEKPTSGAVTLSISGTTASWTYEGTAPHGFKLVISQAPTTPAYGSAFKQNYTGSPHEINYLDSGTYNVRVCKYTASDYEGGCMDYSNQVQIVIP